MHFSLNVAQCVVAVVLIRGILRQVRGGGREGRVGGGRGGEGAGGAGGGGL